MSYLSAIGLAKPETRFSQSTIAEFMVRSMMADESDARKIRTIFKMSGINSRHSVLEDYGKSEGFSFYPNRPGDAFPSTERRMAVYKQHALPLSVAAVGDLLSTMPDLDVNDITHLVVVSCTGMYAPGLDIDIIRGLKLKSTVERTSINFMGCYAAFNALKAADAFCSRNSNSRVLIVCTELCSIHFQRTVSDDNILANALFADGAAAMLVESHTSNKRSFSLEQFHNDLAFNGADHMAWEIGNYGFEMKLSAYVPDLIKSDIGKLLDALLKKLDLRRHDLNFFALHPGGKRILQAIGEQLQLSESELEPATSVLANCGNMSSASIVFVLKSILDRLTSADDQALVMGAAFGPGLTLESMVLKCEVKP